MHLSSVICNIIILIFVYLCTFILLSTLCKPWIYSPLFVNDSKTYKQHFNLATTLNEERVKYAENYFDQIGKPIDEAEVKSSETEDGIVDIAIGMVTIHRKSGYFVQSLAAIDKEMKRDRLFKKVLYVCNVEKDPTYASKIEKLDGSLKIYNKYYTNQSSVSNSFEKEKQDYIFCLQKGNSYHPKYVIILEDDVLVHEHVFSAIHQILNTNIPLHMEYGHEQRWSFIKLFYPDKWRGFSKDILSLLEFSGLFILGGSCFVLLMSLIVKQHSRYRTTNILHFIIGGIYCAFVCCLIGRVYVLNFIYYFTGVAKLLSPAPGCCTPAVLYPSYIIKELTSFLETKQCTSKHPMDIAIDEFVKLRWYKTFVVEPNLMTHIGMVSSIKGKTKRPAEFIYI